MGTTSDKLTYLNTTKDKLKTTINYTGANIDNNTTFREYDEKLYNALASSLIDNQTIFDNMPKVTGSGTDLTLNNTTESKMQLTYKGNTQQDSTTGKNLLNVPSSYSVTGYKTLSVNIPAGTYVANLKSAVLGGSTNAFMRFMNGDNELAYFNIDTTHLSKTITVNNTITTIYIYSQDSYAHSQGVTSTFNELMLSTSGGEYEPYTNGASPNPDYPQTIHSVSGDNDIEVCGKQFFRDEYIGTPGNTINAVLKKGTYTIATCDSNQMGTNIYFKLFDYYSGSVITTSGHFSANAGSFNFSSSSYSYYGGSTTTKFTFTIDNDYKLNIGLLNSDSTRQVMLVKGNTEDRTYQPYTGATYPINLGDIELNKIGDYQDSISKYEDTIKVPNGYTQVEYIQSSGTQYIDTGISPTTNTGFKIKASCTTENNTDKILIGSRASSNRFWVDFDYNNGNKRIYGGFGNIDNIGNYVLDTDYEIDFNYNGTKKVITNGVSYDLTGTFDSTGSLPMYIFRANYSSPIAGNFKVYYCQIYNGTTLVRDFIPCIRNSDSVVGLYDLVSKTFFTNAGTGTFTYGREVGKWYIGKEIGSVVLDGSESWASYQTGGNNLKRTFLALTNAPTGNDRQPLISNYFKYCDTYANDYIGCGFIGAGRVYLYPSQQDSKSDFLTWLGTNNTIIKYPLATPTYTKITNTTLLGQLNAIKKSYEGQTNISQVNDDLPFILDVSAIKKYE